MRAVEPKHIRFAAGTTEELPGAAAIPKKIGTSSGLNRKPARKPTAPAHAPAKAPEPVEGECQLDLLGVALTNSRIISRSLGGILDSNNRAGDFIAARGAAVRLVEILTDLLALEEPIV